MRQFFVAAALVLLSGQPLAPAAGAGGAFPHPATVAPGHDKLDETSDAKKWGQTGGASLAEESQKAGGKAEEARKARAKEQSVFIQSAAAEFNQKVGDVQGLYAAYNAAILRVKPELVVEARQSLARDFVRARYADKTLLQRLADGLSWLSVRTTGDQSRDAHLLEYSTLAATKVLSAHLSRENIAVLATGLRAETQSRLEDIAIAGGATSTAALHDALSDKTIDWTSDQSWLRLSAESGAMRMFTNKLLILAAHHDSPGGSEAGAYVLVSKDGGQSIRVPVAALKRLAAIANVNLFILGCSTAASSDIGTEQAITTEQAIAGLERVFQHPVSTYADVFKSLADPAFDLIFDVRLAIIGNVELVDRRDGRMRVTWEIPTGAGYSNIPVQPASTQFTLQPSQSLAVSEGEPAPLRPSFSSRLDTMLQGSFITAFMLFAIGCVVSIICLIGAFASEALSSSNKETASGKVGAGSSVLKVTLAFGGAFSFVGTAIWALYGLWGITALDGARVVGGIVNLAVICLEWWVAASLFNAAHVEASSTPTSPTPTTPLGGRGRRR